MNHIALDLYRTHSWRTAKVVKYNTDLGGYYTVQNVKSIHSSIPVSSDLYKPNKNIY